MSKWLAVAEGGLYKTVDKKVVNALVEDVVRSGDGIAREISWSVTERVPDVILFHIDYPFDPASEEGAAFIESLKADIRSLETAERRPMSHKIASAEIVSIQPAEPLPEPAADLRRQRMLRPHGLRTPTPGAGSRHELEGCTRPSANP